MSAAAGAADAGRLNRDAYLLCFSAFFADLGYQGVAALFPLLMVLRLRAPIAAYGLATALAFGGGAFFSYLGGIAGDRHDKKRVAIAGNALIPLMALAGVMRAPWASALLFILGWWARYFRTPARRALLVNVTRPELRGKAFAILHALDIAGGMLSALAVMLFLAMRVAVGTIMLFAVGPLVISTALLFFVRRAATYPAVTPMHAADGRGRADRALLIGLLVATTLYGFSFYNLGFPILTATGGRATSAGYEAGVLAFAVYLGVSALSGYVLGVRRASPTRSLWLLGYLPSALGSGLIGVSVLMHLPAAALYLAVAVLGLGMGAVETFEPTLVSALVQHSELSRGMGFLSVSRSVGQFLSNLAMGLLFVLGPSAPYFYAFVSALLAALVLGGVARRQGRGAGSVSGFR
ncbi:MAG TPA: MFS transporter [Steroidobacteraceae bacterium]|nr:MFS transporter [Steroidobacteraceae bacterium]